MMWIGKFRECGELLHGRTFPLRLFVRVMISNTVWE